MKIKAVACLMACMFLSGCTKKAASMQDDLNERIAQVNAERTSAPVYSHGYYSFNVQPSIGRISSTAESDIFNRYGTKFFMNLNIPAIINAAYYDGTDSSLLDVNAIEAAHAEGSYADYQGIDHPFTVGIYQLHDSYLVLADTDTVSFGTVCSELEAPACAGEMIRIARTVDVDEKTVLAEFSGRQDISYSRQKLELFRNIAPENGAINELFDNSGSSDEGKQGEFIGDNFADPDASAVEEPQSSSTADSAD